MRKWLELLLNRVVIIGLLIFIQLGLLLVVLWQFNDYFVYFYAASVVLSLIIVLRVINSRRNPAYKLAWAILVLLEPILGALMYALFGRVRTTKKKLQKRQEIEQVAAAALQGFNEIPAESLEQENTLAYKQAYYMQQWAGAPLYRNTDTEYFPLGELMFERMKEELEKAQHYIFFEYFIIQPGVMWDPILEILARKAKEGLDVRVVYDDVGCSFTLPGGYHKTLEALGIKCGVFRPFVPVLSSSFNNRSHRKCTVIDGVVGFTGGINIADEYINAKEVFGHWKDTAVLLRGDAVWSMAVQFLTQWDYIHGVEKPYEAFRPKEKYQSVCNGYAQPYNDNPLDTERVGATIYMNMIAAAQKYLYVMTPYLIIDNEMLTAFCMAAKSGVDVRILTPFVRDKWFVHPVTRSYYEPLIESGVKVYEYTPGFVHAKSFVSDDLYGVIGTVNLDFRSLYLHMENGVWFYQSQAVAELRDDYLKTLEVSHQVSLQECQNIPWYVRLGRSILKLFSPLL